MEAPASMLGPEAFAEVIQTHIDCCYTAQDGERYRCKKCSSVIEHVICTVPLHNKVFGAYCIDLGKAIQVSLPYCPECEGPPQRTKTCIHI